MHILWPINRPLIMHCTHMGLYPRIEPKYTGAEASLLPS